MSNEALTAVAKSDIRPSGRKFVAMALADYADEAWSCFPSVEQLARYTSQGEKTVRDHLDALESAGVLTRERQRRDDGTLGRYRFKLQRRNLPVAEIANGEKHPEPAAKSATHNPQREPSSVVAEREPTQFDELVKVLDREHANAVIAHRKHFKGKFTPYAAKLLAAKLAKCPDPNAAAETMIANGWQGFEPDWIAGRQQSRASPAPKASSSSALADSAARLAQSMRSNDEIRSRSGGSGVRALVSHLPVR